MRSFERIPPALAFAFACACLVLAACSSHERRGLTLGSACNQDFQCDDAHVCNGVERCLAGTCALGETPDCDDGDACTRDGCTEGLGCVHVTRDAPMCRGREPVVDAGGDAGARPIDAALPDAQAPSDDAAALDASEPVIEEPLDPAHAPKVTCNSAVPQLQVMTQEQLDRYDGIECVTGTLHVSGEIETLEPLRNLRWVGGDATFMDIDTRQLPDLSRLVRVDGSLYFYSDGGLYWVQGLPSLRFVGRSFGLYESYTSEPRSWPAINVVTGPSKLRNVGGDLILTVGSRIEGFAALERVGGNVFVTSPELTGFDALTSIEGSLIFERIGGVAVTSFAALTHVGGDFRVRASSGLQSLAGLSALEHVGGLIDVRGNPRLEVLPPALRYFASLDVRLNPALSRCTIDALVERARANGSVAEPVTCCNRGCESCIAGGCDVVSTPLSGQSTHYEGEIRRYEDDFPIQAMTTMTRVTRLEIAAWPLFGEPRVILPLETVDDQLYLSGAGQDDLLSFSRLERVGSLGIGSSWMTTLEGLEGLRAITNRLDLNENSQLRDVSVLDPARGSALEALAVNGMQIYANTSLPLCEAQTLVTAARAFGAAQYASFYVDGVCEGTCEGPTCVPLPELPDAGASDAGD